MKEGLLLISLGYLVDFNRETIRLRDFLWWVIFFITDSCYLLLACLGILFPQDSIWTRIFHFPRLFVTRGLSTRTYANSLHFCSVSGQSSSISWYNSTYLKCLFFPLGSVAKVLLILSFKKLSPHFLLLVLWVLLFISFLFFLIFLLPWGTALSWLSNW